MTASDAKEMMIKSFVQAGPWAVLCLLVIGAIGYEVDWFVRQYVGQTMALMTRITDSVEHTQRMIETNRELIAQSTKSSEAVATLMHDAQATMYPVAKERQEQTVLLREIKELLQRREDRHTAVP